MGTQPGDIEVGWGEESVERSSAVVPAVQANERWGVLDEYSRARTRFCILSGREGDIRESTASLEPASFFEGENALPGEDVEGCCKPGAPDSQHGPFRSGYSIPFPVLYSTKPYLTSHHNTDA